MVLCPLKIEHIYRSWNSVVKVGIGYLLFQVTHLENLCSLFLQTTLGLGYQREKVSTRKHSNNPIKVQALTTVSVTKLLTPQK